MATWTMIDDDYPQDTGSEEVDIEISADIVARIDYFIDDNTNPRLIICEGDSWFHYSRFFGYSNLLLPIKDELQAKDQSPNNVAWGLVNLGYSGDTLADIAKDKQIALLQKILKRYRNNNYVKCVLFSAGGNDIIEAINGAGSPLLTPKGLDKTKLNSLMIDIKANYAKLVSAIHAGTNNQQIPIFTHSYDYPCAFGQCSIITKLLNCPWIKPVVDSNGLQEEISSIIIEIFNEFYAAITSVDGLSGVKTIGTLDTNPDLWSDEIHPNTSATNQIAKVYVASMISQHPNLLT